MAEHDELYQEFYYRAKSGEANYRSLLLYRYTTMRDEMPNYCIEYIEGFIQNVAREIIKGDGISPKLFPDNPTRRVSKTFGYHLDVAYFVYRSVKNDGFLLPRAKELAAVKYSKEVRSIEKSIQKVKEFQEKYPDSFSVPLADVIKTRKK